MSSCRLIIISCHPSNFPISPMLFNFSISIPGRNRIKFQERNFKLKLCACVFSYPEYHGDARIVEDLGEGLNLNEYLEGPAPIQFKYEKLSGNSNFPMDFRHCKTFRPVSSRFKRIIILVITIFLLRAVLSPFPSLQWFTPQSSSTYKQLELHQSVRKDKFLQVPQITWGLNNQKIALARSLLTARYLNRTLLMPSLSATLFYKELDLLEPIEFDKIFDFEKFNSICSGFVRIGKFSELLNKTEPFELTKGSGRKWTKERDLNQLMECKNDSKINNFEVIRILGKNPFLWHDHWPVKGYAEIFDCLVLINEIENDVTKVISKIREVATNSDSTPPKPYIAVHMRIEKDWMIHCKKMEQRANINQICSSKEEIIEKVSNIKGINKPVIVYLAVADSLLEDGSILNGWREGLIPYEKKRLGVWNIYKKYPYLIQSAVDFEVCLRADVFVGNSFSTFSGLVVLSRTQRLIKLGVNTGLVSYAYNVLGDAVGEPKQWITDMSESSLQSISYGTTNISRDIST